MIVWHHWHYSALAAFAFEWGNRLHAGHGNNNMEYGSSIHRHTASPASCKLSIDTRRWHNPVDHSTTLMCKGPGEQRWLLLPLNKFVLNSRTLYWYEHYYYRCTYSTIMNEETRPFAMMPATLMAPFGSCLRKSCMFEPSHEEFPQNF